MFSALLSNNGESITRKTNSWNRCRSGALRRPDHGQRANQDWSSL